MIFTPEEHIEMAQAAVNLSLLRGAPLIELVSDITTLDNPYYMELEPSTYHRLVGPPLLPCQMCLLTPYSTASPNPDWNLDNPRSEWVTDRGTCDCLCPVCTEVREGRALWVFRYSDEGREVKKIKLAGAVLCDDGVTRNNPTERSCK